MSPRRANPLTLEYVILGLIRLQPTHGYDLFHILQQEEGIGAIWQIKPGRLYALLEKLETLGWLQPEVKLDGFPPRKQFRLSQAGEEAFMEWLYTPVPSAHRMRQEFLARLFFAPFEGQAALDRIIENQKRTCNSWLESLEKTCQALAPDQNFDRQVYRFRIGQTRAMLEWLDHCIEGLVSIDNTKRS